MSACLALTQEGAEREALRGCLVHPHVPVGTWTDTVQPRVVRNRMEVGGGNTKKGCSCQMGGFPSLLASLPDMQ